MANHNYTRAGGVWADDTDLLYSEIADLDWKSTDAMSGEGGTYALTEPWIVGGDPGTYVQFDAQVNITEPLVLTGDLESYGDVYLGGSGSLLFDSPATFNDDVTIGQAGTSLTVDATVYFQDNANFYDIVAFYDDCTFVAAATFDGVATFNDEVTFEDVANFNEATYFSAQATFYEQTVFQKPITFSGTARIQERQIIGGDANASYAAQSYTHVHCQASTLTASRAYTIDDTGALNGDRMRFSTRDSGFDIEIKNPGGSVLTAINPATQPWVDVERILGSWYVMPNPT